MNASDDQRFRQAQSDLRRPRRHGGSRVRKIAKRNDMVRTDRVDQFGEAPERLLTDTRRAGAPSARKVAALPR